MTRQCTEAEVMALADSVWGTKEDAYLWDGWRTRGDEWAWRYLCAAIERGADRVGTDRPEVSR